MDIRVLGPLEIERDGEPLNLGGTKQRSVLAVLVLHAREVVTTDRIGDAVWDGASPASADTTLRGYVFNLRKALEPGRASTDDPRILRTTKAGYVLDVPDEQIDARRFEHLVAAGRDHRAGGHVADAVEQWSDALALWRGDAFQDFAYSDFVQAEVARLAELRLTCSEELFEAQLELGRHSTVVGDLEAFCTAHPDRERALALRMLALYRCGRQSDALRVYEQGRRRLADELGVDPSPELRALHEQIIRQDDALASLSLTEEPSRKHTLTFLLGDVEQSTAKLWALRDEYAGILEEHRRLLTQTFTYHGGRDLRTHSDSMFAAFDCATDAVAAAVAAQVAISTSGFGENRTLPLRMGLHTGEAKFTGGEYVGLAVHLAARIMDAAHGGQVLVSQATKELFETEQQMEIEFADTGTHTLKDIPDVVRLFQVIHPELRRDFPALRTRAGRSDNLPHRPTSFVGRTRDLERIEHELTDSRVVTLTGVGGVGKTRLALEAGTRLVPRYPDGVWLCELAPIGDADGLIHSVATTLRIEQQPGSTVRESLVTALRQWEALLIFDNCEHLMAPVADLVEDIVRCTAGTDILATSREALDVDGEYIRPVRSLAISTGEADAVRLFEDRARARRPDFAVDETNADDVAGICARLDGIPLAIELAAARVTAMSPAQIAARLEEGFRFLRSGRRAAVDRHRTLHGAIDWSYEMLPEAERTLFDRLSVFAGGFTLDAAEDVCGRGLDLDIADGLASLVAKSMVDADVTGDEARFTLLETMRQYAQDRLSSRDDAEGILRAHATYFAGMLESMADAARMDSEDLVRRVAAEMDNLRAAQAWARSSRDVDLTMAIVAWPSILSVFFSDVLAWAAEATTMPGAKDHPSFPVVMAMVANGAGRTGDLVRARELSLRALDLIDHPDDPRRLLPLIELTWVAAQRGHLEEARRLNDEWLRVARANDELPTLVWGHATRGLIESFAGDHAKGIEWAEAAYAVARTGSTALQGMALYALGDTLTQTGQDAERALDCLEQSIALCRANRMHFMAGVSLISLASMRARHGDPLEALPMFRDIVDHWRRGGEWGRQWNTIRNLAELLARIGDDDTAATLLAASEASATATPIFGTQGDRLAKLRRELSERMGGEAFAVAIQRGRAMSDEEAVAYAKAEIDRALDHLRVHEDRSEPTRF